MSSQCAIAFRVRFNQIEKGEHKIKLNLVNEDGKLIIPSLETSAKVDFPPHLDSGVMNMVLHIQGLKLEKFGKYSFDLAIDGRQEASLPLLFKTISRCNRGEHGMHTFFAYQFMLLSIRQTPSRQIQRSLRDR